MSLPLHQNKKRRVLEAPDPPEAKPRAEFPKTFIPRCGALRHDSWYEVTIRTHSLIWSIERKGRFGVFLVPGIFNTCEPYDTCDHGTR
jgi:hypothetical protein